MHRLWILGFVVCWATGAHADEVTGAWNVTSKLAGANTCGATGKTSVYQWLVAQNGPTIGVQVVGETSFPKLVGSLKGGEIVLEGEGAPLGTGFLGIRPSSVFTLTFDKGKLRGHRYYIGAKARTGGGSTLCMTVFEVTATKQ
ncbi:MAG: hypothetical protein H6704_09590 [Myxococcales bacterium]|nr:hypothetical protein [Myxococcales bacterium]